MLKNEIKIYSDYFKIDDYTGWITYSEKGLCSLKFPKKNTKQPPNTINKNHPLTKKLKIYFKGKKIEFNDKIDWRNYSDFEKKVFKECQQVKYGKVLSYKELACKIGKPKAYRAVGNVLAKNKLPIIIPCHRIINSRGGIGGFAYGQELKKNLLDMEHNE